MRWAITCAGCGQTLQVGEGQRGRLLRCPACRLRVAVERPQAPAAPPGAGGAGPRPRRRRLWLLGGLAALALAGLAVIPARVPWSQEDDVRRATAGMAGPTMLMPIPAGMPGREAGIARGVGPTPQQRQDLLEPSAWEAPLEVPAGAARLELAGKIPASLAVALDPRTGLVLASSRDGQLRWFDPANWQLAGSCRLERPAYHLVVDAARRLLYAASAAPASLRVGPLGDQEQADADLFVYDLDAVLKGGAGAASAARRLGVNSHLTALALSPDGAALYCLSEGAADVRLASIDTREFKQDRTLWLRVSPPTALALAPDGRTLYALAGNRVIALDARSWKVTQTVSVSNTAQALQAGKSGQVYLLERGPSRGVWVRVIDVPTRKEQARWNLHSEGTRAYFRLSPDLGRIYLATSAVTSGRIWAVDVAAGSAVRAPRVVGQAGGDRRGLLRGALFVTEDGKFVVNGAGFVFRAAS